MKREILVGRSSVRFEPPDLLVEEIVGELSLAEARGIIAAADELSAGATDIYILGDISRIGPMSPEVRRFVREVRPPQNIRAIALVGASPHIRVLVTLLMKAVSLFWKQPNETRFLETQAQARAWLDELRRQRSTGGD